MHRIDAIGNSPGVRRELAEVIGNLLGWRKGVRQKKTETHRKIIGSSQKAYRDSLGDLSNGIGKLARNMSGDHRKKTRRLTARMSEAAGLVGEDTSSWKGSPIVAELLLPSRASYAHNLSHTDDKLRSFQSCLKRMCINQYDVKHAIVTWSLFLLDIFIHTTSPFVLSYAPIHHAYDVIV
ncbi:hypothetical protein B296_00050600 [Ensete ventricosum]|uniref:Uncharacterized protein n=1 Tax=Ensete ventricosum TaxID=4639 RepID=A0A426X0G2_ENSVE|nr:hypothetical protein B296_00050600 [Ensete ventricosum]